MVLCVLFYDSISNYGPLYYAHNFNTTSQNNNTTYRIQKNILNIFHEHNNAQSAQLSKQQSTATVGGLVLFAISLSIRKKAAKDIHNTIIIFSVRASSHRTRTLII